MKKKYKLIKVSYNIGENDLNTKKRKVQEFVEKQLDVKIELRTHGRQKYLYKDKLDKLKGMFSEFKIINSWEKGNSCYLFIR